MRYCVYPINRYIIPERVVELVSDCIRFLRLKLRNTGKIDVSKIIENVNNLKRINLIIKNKMLLDLLIILTYRFIENL